MKTIERIVKHYITSLIALALTSVSGYKVLSNLDTVEWPRLIIYGSVFSVGIFLFFSSDTLIKKTGQRIVDKFISKK